MYCNNHDQRIAGPYSRRLRSGRHGVSFSQSALPDDVQVDILRANIVEMAKGDGAVHQGFAGILSSMMITAWIKETILLWNAL
jgi:hypothetical protein